VARAGALGPLGHIRLAGWREGGALLGVTAAAVAPAFLVQMTAAPYALFAASFAVLCLAGAVTMRQEWAGPVRHSPSGFRTILADPVARGLLVLAVVNAAPLGVTSTLFLFFVQGRLAAPGWEGPLLVLFFLSAALAAPLWARLAARHAARSVLSGAMLLSVAVFAFATSLGAGDVAAFAAVCVLSGAAVGADLVILPALFARRMSQIAPDAGEGFGLWSFASKFTLAFAAVLLLPLLDARGFVPGGDSPEAALSLLSLLYAALPCAIKLVAIALLWVMRLPED
jgi:GPH family glycoside/pentoside/hexuronide:cation symporter